MTNNLTINHVNTDTWSPQCLFENCKILSSRNTLCFEIEIYAHDNIQSSFLYMTDRKNCIDSTNIWYSSAIQCYNIQKIMINTLILSIIFCFMLPLKYTFVLYMGLQHAIILKNKNQIVIKAWPEKQMPLVTKVDN